MNIAALNEHQKKLAEAGGSEGFLSTKDIGPDGLIVRLMPDPPQLEGLFYFPVVKYWMMVNGKVSSVICCSTFPGKDGKPKPSVIQAEIDEAMASEDEDVQATLHTVNPKTGMQILKMEEEFWMEVLQVEYKLDANNEIESIIIVGNRVKTFQTSKITLIREMAKHITSRVAVSNSKKALDGPLDRVNGSNLLLTKTGTAKETRYFAALEACGEMPKKFYTNIPNVYEIVQEQMKNPSWQRAAIRNFLYGEAIPADVQAKEDARAAKVKAEGEAKRNEVPKKKVAGEEAEEEAPAPKPKKAATPVKKAAPVEEPDEDYLEAEEVEEEETPPPTKKAATKKPALLDDDDDLDAPTPVKKSAPKKAAVIEEDDELEEEEAPKPKKKSPPPPPTPAKKAAAPKRSILDELEDEDE